MTTQFEADQEQEDKLKEIRQKVNNFFKNELESVDRLAELIRQMKAALEIEE